MSRSARDAPLDCKIYVGDLPRDASEKEIERAFSYYGPLRSVWVAKNPPGFAFVEFEDNRDADDAVRGLDGTCVDMRNHKLENGFCVNSFLFCSHQIYSCGVSFTAQSVAVEFVWSTLLGRFAQSPG